MNIGERIKLLRLKKGMTQEELAIKLGYKSKSSVAHIENGRDIPRSMVVTLAKILETTPASLMGWEDKWDKTVEELNKEFADRDALLTAYLEKVYDDAQDRDLAHALILQLPRVNTKCLEALNCIVYELAGKEENMSDFEKAVQEELNNHI